MKEYKISDEVYVQEYLIPEREKKREFYGKNTIIKFTLNI